MIIRLNNNVDNQMFLVNLIFHTVKNKTEHSTTLKTYMYAYVINVEIPVLICC